MRAIREFLNVKEKQINYTLPDNFNYDRVEVIILPIENDREYELWSDRELELISQVDFSTPIEDDEDYSKW